MVEDHVVRVGLQRDEDDGHVKVLRVTCDDILVEGGDQAPTPFWVLDHTDEQELILELGARRQVTMDTMHWARYRADLCVEWLARAEKRYLERSDRYEVALDLFASAYGVVQTSTVGDYRIAVYRGRLREAVVAWFNAYDPEAAESSRLHLQALKKFRWLAECCWDVQWESGVVLGFDSDDEIALYLGVASTGGHGTDG
jgi:hypothetical protein